MTKQLNLCDVQTASEDVKLGKVVAFPTDTVYGVGVRYDDAKAIEQMKWVKGRPESKPFPMMVCDVEQMSQVAYLDEDIKKIVEQLTPGALTLVMKKKDSVADFVTNGAKTIAIRIPDHEFVLSLLKKVGCPMLVTSANLSDYPSCKNFDEVMAQLDGRLDTIVNGPCGSGVASTIVDVTSTPYRILRAGTISLEEIMEVLK